MGLSSTKHVSIYYRVTGDPLDYDISIPARYVPQPIDVLVARTKFTHDEVKRLYCGWKQNCPYGVVDKDQFIKCFSEIYPAGGDCKPYASRVFDAIMERSDKQQYDGIVQVVAHACDPEGIDFERFIMFLSQIMRGTDEQKLEWCFCLYDRDRRGFITQKNIVDFTFSIYELLDEEHVLPRLQYSSVYKQAISTYQKLDTAHRGTITKDEFIAACLQDNVIRQSLNVFDSMI